MIALDTNVLVRLVTEDDPEQFRQADRWLRHCRDSGESCLVSVPVLCELLWVLKRLYRASRPELALVVETLMDDGVFVVENAEAVGEALNRFRRGRADFADYLIGAKGAALGASTTLTFDSALARERGFTWLGSSSPEPGQGS